MTEHAAAFEEDPEGPIGGRATRQRLDLESVSRDGDRLLLRDLRGAEYTLFVTPELRAALAPGAEARTRQETPMDSALRPRDIQMRIRAGESAEAVAQAGNTTVEKIMPFVAPVLAERQHVAERARASHIRRSGSAGGAARTLDDAVESVLRAQNVDPATVEWDAWRREDGRWSITALFEVGARSGLAELSYDLPGNYVVLDNDDARWLAGDLADPAGAGASSEFRADELHQDELHSARQRRLGAVAHDDLPLGDDALELVREDVVPVDESVEEPVEVPVEQPVDSPMVESVDQPLIEDPTLDFDEPEPAPEPAEEPAPPRRAVQKRKGRASVPSWDEIMFGGGDS